MRALLKPSILRLVALVVLLIPVLAFTDCPCTTPPTSSTTSAISFEGCFDFTSTINPDGPARHRFASTGNGAFEIGSDSSKQTVSLDLLIDTNLKLLSGNAEVLTQDGLLFIDLKGTTMGPDDNKVVTFGGMIKPYGGTRGMMGTKGGGRFNGSVNLDTGVGSICFDGYIFKTFSSVPSLPPYIPLGPSTQSLAVFSLLLAGWMAFLLLRRKRGMQS